MAIKYFPRSVYNDFMFFTDGDGAAATMDASIDLEGTAWFLRDVRVAFSGVCSNDIYLRIHVDAVQSTDSTRYDGYILSYALSNSIWYAWQPSQPMMFQGSDVVEISCVTDNVYSVTVSGWAVSGT